MKRENPRIDGKRWVDLGSDVNWIDHGGMWGRAAGPDAPGLWFVIRFDPESCEFSNDCYTCCATLHEIDLNEITEDMLQCGGVPLDGLDEYGKPIDPAYLRAWSISAAASYGEGIVARVTARVRGPGAAIRVRVAAARYLLGDYIECGPFDIR